MGDKSGIQWTDATWNPVVGCSKVSPGCANCYAEDQHRRLLDDKHGYPPFKPWTPKNAEHNVTLMRRKLEQPLRWTKPRMVFVNSMSDLFHERLTGLPDLQGKSHPRRQEEPPRPEYIAEVFAVMSIATQHTFQVLTKRPRAMQALLTHPNFWMQVNAARLRRHHHVLPGSAPFVLPNVWLGTSIENRRFVDRADLLRETPAAVRFISAEPLLGPLAPVRSSESGTREGEARVTAVGSGATVGSPRPGAVVTPPQPTGSLDLTGIDWLIVGGESGPGHRPIKPEWVRDLRDVTQADHNDLIGTSRPHDEFPRWAMAGTHFFFKQWGGPSPKANGRELDGRTWDEMPAVAA